ncbi:MAG: hypothetical protein CMJ18_26155 [Phycisphaeraceae bacterium]|nr:hypothetical protein [Phycisphaeraceae bacterium]
MTTINAQTETTPVTMTANLIESGEDGIVLALAGTDYRLHLKVAVPVTSPLNRPVAGRIKARARRVDRMRCGGRFIEPVYGRPRRVQGTITGTDFASNRITVRSGGGSVFECDLTADQKAADFEIGALVGFDVERGAKFEL